MIVLDNGDAIRGIGEVASKLSFTVSGYVGTTATSLAQGQLGSSEGDLYASGANATVVTSITVVNTDSAARTFTLYFLESGGGTSWAISPVSLDLPVGYSFYTDGQRAVVMSTGGEVVSTYSAHKDSHDPEDGTDPLDGAAPSELVGVQASGEGSAHELARADHAHQIQESMANNHLVTVNQADVAENDIPRFSATGGLQGLTYAQLLGVLSGEADAEFLFNTQKIGGVVDPTTNQQVATKKYVDDNAGASQANQAALEAETNEDTYAPPDLIKHSPGIPKVWVLWEQNDAHGIIASYNMTSVTDGGGVGDTDHLYNVDFSAGGVSAAVFGSDNHPVMINMVSGTDLAGGINTITIGTNTFVVLDRAWNSMAVFGDQ